jgi:spore coat polysaccharide biosynthesis protein SpsF (cytidylyltransferase family)
VKVIAVVQARTGSTRLPGKVLADVGGIPLIAHSLRRLRAAGRVDEVVLATTEHHSDDALVELASREDVEAYRGPEHDVLSRVRGAAESVGADAVVRITGDCPLLDPDVVDRVVAALVDAPDHCDYASNVLRRTYPKGLDAEALWLDTLRRIDELATSTESREHVTWFAYRERPDLFTLRSVEGDEDRSDLDWSVDTADDLERMRALVAVLDSPDQAMPWRELADRAGV